MFGRYFFACKNTKTKQYDVPAPKVRRITICWASEGKHARYMYGYGYIMYGGVLYTYMLCYLLKCYFDIID